MDLTQPLWRASWSDADFYSEGKEWLWAAGQRDLQVCEVWDQGRNGRPRSHGRESSLGQQNPAAMALQILPSVFAHCNLASNGEKAVCVFICFGKLAQAKRAALFVRCRDAFP